MATTTRTWNHDYSTPYVSHVAGFGWRGHKTEHAAARRVKRDQRNARQLSGGQAPEGWYGSLAQYPGRA